MKLYALIAAACLLAVSATQSHALVVTLDVHANNNVWNGGKGGDNILNTDPGLSTGLILEIGDVFQVDVVNPNDTWNFCNPSASCTVDADGRRPAFGTFIGNYSNSGFSEKFGALVGRVGTGDFFLVGTAGFDGPATSAGLLRLYHWDHNNNNSGTIQARASFEVAPVPLPASLPLLLAGLCGFGFISRRKKSLSA